MAYTEDKKPAGLTPLTSLETNDTVIVGDTSDTQEVVKAITWGNLVTLIEALSSYFNVTTGTLDDITAGTTNKHFTAADESKLDGIEANADVTDATNVAAAGAYMSGGTDVPVTDGGTGASTAAGARTNLGVDPAGTDNSTDVTLSGTGTYISIAGQVITVDPITESDIADLGTYITDITGSPLSELSDVTITTIASGEVLKWNGTAWINQTLSEAGIQEILAEGAFVDGDKTKLDGIETGADVTDTTNVTAAGALMDSEVTNLAQVKTFDSSDYATAAQGATADAALPASSYDDATAAETNTGTSTAKYVSPDALAGSNFGIRYVQIRVFEAATDTATGDGKATFKVPAGLDGMNLISVDAEVDTAGTTGTTDIQFHNVDNALDMLSTKLTIDSGETGSDTAATAAVINTANDHVNTNDIVRIDVDAVSTTAAQGLVITMGFQLP